MRLCVPYSEHFQPQNIVKTASPHDALGEGHPPQKNPANPRSFDFRRFDGSGFPPAPQNPAKPPVSDREGARGRWFPHAPANSAKTTVSEREYARSRWVAHAPANSA